MSDDRLDRELGICIGSGAVESTIKQIGIEDENLWFTIE
jgi:hypothetical protein